MEITEQSSPLVLPMNRAAEAALLGALIQQPKDAEACVLEVKHFSDWKNQEVYKTIRQITEAGREANYWTLGESLQNRDAFEDVMLSLDYLRGSYYHQKTIEQLEFEILEAYRKRTAIEDLRHEFARLYKPDSTTEGIFSDMISKITKISDPLLMETYSLDELMALIKTRAANPTNIYGVETGLAAFDRETHGLQQKEVFLLSGQPGSGKSMLAGQLALGMAEHGTPGVFYSLEMSAEALWMRWLSAKVGINTDRLKQGWDMHSELGRVQAEINKLKSVPIIIREQGNWTPLRLRADIARLKAKQGIEFVVIDYMDLLRDPDAADKTEKSENLVVHLHNLCLEFDVAILTIQSLVKAGFGDNPEMDDVSGSAKVSFTVDQMAVMIGKREDKVKKLRWLKLRHSPGTRNLEFMFRKGLPELVPVVEVDEDEYSEVYRG